MQVTLRITGQQDQKIQIPVDDRDTLVAIEKECSEVFLTPMSTWCYQLSGVSKLGRTATVTANGISVCAAMWSLFYALQAADTQKQIRDGDI